jgi:demethoxyubiquinone hydroxylase (CLK1/Coq7/Cat5 family)
MFRKALGQVSLYQSRYRESLIVVVFPDQLDPKHLATFKNELTQKKVPCLVKPLWDS